MATLVDATAPRDGWLSRRSLGSPWLARWKVGCCSPTQDETGSALLGSRVLIDDFADERQWTMKMQRCDSSGGESDHPAWRTSCHSLHR
jgi:hypothetical protein